YRLGINEDVAETLMELSPAQIVRLAGSSSLLCNFRLNDYDLLKTLSKDVLGGVLQKAHSTILLAQRATATLTADRPEAYVWPHAVSVTRPKIYSGQLG